MPMEVTYPSELLSRRRTFSVKIGDLYIGSEHSIKSQSMTTTSTADVGATVEQICTLSEAGCLIARVTVQGIKESRACEQIKEQLLALGVNIPLVADIHFFPQAAMHVVDFVDKVRINPGNFVDKRNMFTGKLYTEASYSASLLRLEEKFSPLVEKCQQQGKAIRIGVNHGSLSERVMQRYGDTIEGMVASALEYAEVCVKMGFHQLVFSMKSSNPRVMVAAYRQLARDLDAKGWHYPLHLGVTEAGMGLDGEIKSSIGIGTLLAEGLGDTIRCSLTGHPVTEIPLCERLLKQTRVYRSLPSQPNPFAISSSEEFRKSNSIESPWGTTYAVLLKLRPEHLNQTPDSLLSDLGIGPSGKAFTTPEGIIVPDDWVASPTAELLRSHLMVIPVSSMPSYTENPKAPCVIFPTSAPRIRSARAFFHNWRGEAVAMLFSGEDEAEAMQVVTESGALLLDGLGHALVLDFPLPLPFLREIAFGTLQSCGVRLVKPEYVSCPGCGRTLFDLPEVATRIRKRTQHLAGLKIAIMGCIVNGPGEMADADFGFVGSKAGMIDLYVKHTCVKSHIPMADAEEELIRLLREHGVWKDPE